VLLAAAVALALSAPCLRGADDVTFASLLAEMVDRTVVTHPPVHPYHTLEAAVPQTEDVAASAASSGGTGTVAPLIASDYRFPGTVAATLAVPVSANGASAPALNFRNSGDTQPDYVARSPNGGAVTGFPNHHRIAGVRFARNMDPSGGDP